MGDRVWGLGFGFEGFGFVLSPQQTQKPKHPKPQTQTPNPNPKPYGVGGCAAPSFARNLPYLAAQAMGFGLTREQALRAITLSAAEVLGVADRLGSIDVGKSADLFVADGDPLEFSTRIEAVYIAGKAVSLETRQTRLFDKYDKRPRGPKARPRAARP
jgi:hypothetical protein